MSDLETAVLCPSHRYGASHVLRKVFFSSGRGVIFNLRTNDNFLCQIFSSPSLSFLSLCHLAGICRSACFSLPSNGI